jgi:hypothetical protein
MIARNLIALFTLTAATVALSAEPTKLSEQEARALLQRAQIVQRAFSSDDGDAIIRYTHPSIQILFDSREQFEKAVRDSLTSLRGQMSVESTDWGQPTSVYLNGTEEVCFIPMTVVARVSEKRVRSVGFLIAARQAVTGEWLFLDCASLRKDPSLLWELFPALPKDVVLPPNTVELIK